MKCFNCDSIDNFKLIESRDLFPDKSKKNIHKNSCTRFRFECSKCSRRMTTYMISDKDLYDSRFLEKIFSLVDVKFVSEKYFSELSKISKFKDEILEMHKSLGKFSEKLKKLEEDLTTT